MLPCRIVDNVSDSSWTQPHYTSTNPGSGILYGHIERVGIALSISDWPMKTSIGYSGLSIAYRVHTYIHTVIYCPLPCQIGVFTGVLGFSLNAGAHVCTRHAKGERKGMCSATIPLSSLRMFVCRFPKLRHLILIPFLTEEKFRHNNDSKCFGNSS